MGGASRQVNPGEKGAWSHALSRPYSVLLLVLGALLTPFWLPGIAQATPGQITEFPVPNSTRPDAITAGPDGNLWFTDGYGSAIGRMTPGGALTEFPVSLDQIDQSSGITSGPNGNLWFTASAIPSGNGAIGQITPSGELTGLPIPTPEGKSGAGGIATGPEGNLWFTLFRGNAIGRITPAGQITEFPIPTPANPKLAQRESWPTAITLGPDGDLWFVDQGRFSIGRITPSGQITEFPIPSMESSPEAIAAGPDGNLWFTEPQANQIGRITPSGYVTFFPIPCPLSCPAEAITAGPEGNLWFTEPGTTPAIGRITPSGIVTQFALRPSVNEGTTQLPGITTGADGNIWFTSQLWEEEGRRNPEPIRESIGRITPGLLAVDIESEDTSVRHGSAKIRLGCVGGLAHSACRGVLRLSRRIGGKATTVAHAAYSLRSDESKSLSLRLKPGALHAISRNYPQLGQVHATATVTGGQGAVREILLRIGLR